MPPSPPRQFYMPSVERTRLHFKSVMRGQLLRHPCAADAESRYIASPSVPLTPPSASVFVSGCWHTRCRPPPHSLRILDGIKGAAMHRIALISEHASPLATIGSIDSGGQNVLRGASRAAVRQEWLPGGRLHTPRQGAAARRRPLRAERAGGARAGRPRDADSQGATAALHARVR